MTPKSRKSGRDVDPSFTERELVERIVKQAIADGAFDQALQARLQGIADPMCRSQAIVESVNDGIRRGLFDRSLNQSFGLLRRGG